MNHIPVLQKEALELLSPKADENFIDATIGSGGHAFEILERIKPKGKLLGIDASQSAIENLAKKIKDKETENRLILVCDNFSNLQFIAGKYNFDEVQGIFADLGFSSIELEASGRGFSFLKDEILDMRFGEQDLTAQKIINEWPEEKIKKILEEFGEERFAGFIARKIIETRKNARIETTFQLAEIIKKATPSFYHYKKIHPATKTFQALRIAVNSELENLKNFLNQAFKILEKGGRLAIISFHSLEDRIVKKFFKEKTEQKLAFILTKKPIKPGLAERVGNPRSRSAKLRALTKNL